MAWFVRWCGQQHFGDTKEEVLVRAQREFAL